MADSSVGPMDVDTAAHPSLPTTPNSVSIDGVPSSQDRPFPPMPPPASVPLLRQQSSNSDMEAFRVLASASGGNMFVNRTWKLPAVQYVKMTILGLTIFPLRLMLTVLNLLGLCLLAALGICGMSESDFDLPLPLWRRIVISPIRPLLRYQLFLLGFHWISIKGTPRHKPEAYLITPNHISFVEPVFLMYYLGGTPVSASENSRLPLIGSVLKAIQTMFVERDKAKRPTNATAVTVTPTLSIQEKITQRAASMQFPQVLIFPEGTCTNGNAVISFKVGAFAGGLPVQPVAVRYPHTAFDPSWASAGPKLPDLLFRMMTQFHNSMEVTFLPVYTPSPAERADPRLFASNVQSGIASCLGVRVTQHSYEDVILAHAAARAKYPIEQAVVEFQALRKVLDIDSRQATGYLQRFMQADVDRSGKLDYAHFKRLLLRSAQPPPAAALASVSSSAADKGVPPLSPLPVSPVATPECSDEMLSPLPGTSTMDGDLLRTLARRGGSPQGQQAAPVLSSDGQTLGSDAELHRLFTLLDVDEDGSLDFRELLVGLSIINERGSNKKKDAFLLAFKMLDVGNRGRLTKAQLEKPLRRVWPELTPTTMDAIFAEADKNRDGTVSATEFVAWASAHGEHLPLFRETFFGFSDELSLLAQEARLGSKR